MNGINICLLGKRNFIINVFNDNTPKIPTFRDFVTETWTSFHVVVEEVVYLMPVFPSEDHVLVFFFVFPFFKHVLGINTILFLSTTPNNSSGLFYLYPKLLVTTDGDNIGIFFSCFVNPFFYFVYNSAHFTQP